jgi:TolA-binding protein
MYIVAEKSVVGTVYNFNAGRGEVTLYGDIFLTRAAARKESKIKFQRKVHEHFDTIDRMERQINEINQEIKSRQDLVEVLYSQGKNAAAGQLNRRIDLLNDNLRSCKYIIASSFEKLAECTAGNPFNVLKMEIQNAKLMA